MTTLALTSQNLTGLNAGEPMHDGDAVLWPFWMCYYAFLNPHNQLNAMVVAAYRKDHQSCSDEHVCGGELRSTS
jgi:hypothetical protein